MIANPDWANSVQRGHSDDLEPFRKEMLAALI
jgi:hypothetical protein